MSEELKYDFTDNINGHPRDLVWFAMRAWTDLVTDGHASGKWIPFKPQDSAWYCKDGSYTVGILIFSTNYENQIATIELGYVEPYHRKRGIYKQLVERLICDLTGKHIYTIESYVHKNNKIMNNLADNQDREDDFMIRRIHIND